MDKAHESVRSMTQSEARAVFDKMVDDATDADTRATRELLREYFTNPEFRTKFAAFSRGYIRRSK